MIEYNPNHDEKAVYDQVCRYLKETEDMRREANEIKTIGDLMNDAIKNKDRSIALLIELLWREKQVIKLTDGLEALDIYFNPQHRERLNVMIDEFVYSGKSIYNNLV